MLRWLAERKLKQAHDNRGAILCRWKNDYKRLLGEIPIQANGWASEYGSSKTEESRCRRRAGARDRYVNLRATYQFFRDEFWP